ncbi:3-phosphoglycerate dehydrogenase [candidate division KSB1 bacterium]|nr:3-phosphoglycerate dehydrogenase [candidate division KSB1 bacterium]
MKVLVCDPMSKEAIELMKEGGLEVDARSGISKEELLGCVSQYDALVVRSATKVTRDVIDRADRLKVIARGGVGLDNIDVAAAREKGIAVFNTPGASAISVAELAIGLMFACVRDIDKATSSTKSGKWEKKRFMGKELYGKTLGFVGAGNIGIEVARRALALGMKVIVSDPVPRPELKELSIPAVALEELLRSADVISIHAPLTDETNHLIGKKEFEKMKDGVVLIDCARGGIVDEKALLDALKSGKVSRAALDVFEVEPPKDNPLLSHENVIATPHIGASTWEGQHRVGIEVAQKMLKFAG